MNKLTRGQADVSSLSIAGDKLTAAPTTLNRVATAHGTVAADRLVKVGVKAIGGAALHAGVLNWQNPEAGAILIERILLDRTTKSTGASTVDIGTTATSSTTASDNLIDGLNAAATEALEDNINDAGTNGKARQKLAAGKWVTFKEASGDVTGLVANAYIFYVNA